MIKLRRFWGHNAFTYQSWDVDLSDQGVVFVRGDNQDAGGSNGAGKSALFDILQHVLYGKTSRGITKDAIVTLNDATDGYVAHLMLERDDGHWWITQSRHHSKFKTGMIIRHHDGERWVTVTKKRDRGKDQPQEQAGKLLSMALQEFCGAVYLGQGAVHAFINGTPAERMRYLGDLFNLHKLDELLDGLTRRLKMLQQELKDSDALELEQAELQRRLDECSGDDLEASLQQLQESRDSANRALEKRMRRRDELRTLLTNAAHREQLLRQFSAIEYDVALDTDFTELLSTQNARLTARRRKLELVQQKQSMLERASLLKQQLGEDDEQFDVVAATASVERLTERLADVRARADRWTRHDELRAQLEALPDVDAQLVTRQLAELSAAAERAAEELSELTQERDGLRRIGDASVCPRCRRPLDAKTIATRLRAIEKRLAELAADGGDRTAQKRELKAQLRSAEELAQLKSELQHLQPLGDRVGEDDVTRLRTKIRGLKDAIAAASSTETLRAEWRQCDDWLMSHADLVPFDDAEVERLTAACGEIERSINSLTEARVLARQILACGDDELDVAALKAKLQSVDEQVAQLSMMREELAVSCGTAAEQHRVVATYRRRLQELTAQLATSAQARSDRHVLNALVGAIPELKRKQLRRIIRGVRDVLPKHASVMFSESGLTFDVKDDGDSLEFVARRVVGGREHRVPVKALCGGEKQRLAVALIFTFHDMLNPTKKLDLLILDEIDHDLDTPGVKSLMELVQSCKERYGSVFMISHRGAIAGANFDQYWTARKQLNVSTLVVDDRRRVVE